ncbi:hypothetical protein NB688_000976 [Xanthomonas sacchari]|uniref:Uncharacterized protein n=1 Tax=Xanthomonas sacchari TaxID=56458 RepID=A0ABT3DXY8_9XANT|nr:hypothetical protein [Xanthomonas sacchari]MCW0400366.1 hypothetical protein [Xanthomonas sacchari]MCW0418810.1 hypothetical protein [Xanthomonas sacchari]
MPPTEVTSVLVANSCEPFTASVLVAATRPAATLVTVRSLPALPTLTVLDGVVPAYAYVTPLMALLFVATTALVVLEEPSATSSWLADAVALLPMAIAPCVCELAALPMAIESRPAAVLSADQSE